MVKTRSETNERVSRNRSLYAHVQGPGEAPCPFYFLREKPARCIPLASATAARGRRLDTTLLFPPGSFLLLLEERVGHTWAERADRLREPEAMLIKAFGVVLLTNASCENFE